MKIGIPHISLALIMTLISVGSVSGTRIGTDPRPRPNVGTADHGPEATPQFSTYYYQRKSLFEVLPRVSGAIIFLGDSITDGCEWDELLANRPIENRGISGDTSEGLLFRLEEIIRSRPSKVFIMIGINDIGQGIPVRTLKANYERILNRFRSDCPQTKVFVQSVLPVGPEVAKDRPLKAVRELNDELRRLCEAEGLTYIDLFPSFVNAEGYLNARYSNDGLHLMGDGYLKWREIIELRLR